MSIAGSRLGMSFILILDVQTTLTCFLLDTYQNICSSGGICIAFPSKAGKSSTMSFLLFILEEQIMEVGVTEILQSQSFFQLAGGCSDGFCG
jgi:hypothetical protein